MPSIAAYAALQRGAELTPWMYRTMELGEFDCKLRILACGLCHSDIHMIDNDWRSSRYPLVPGHEAIALVESIGNSVTHLKIGDRVGVGWQRSACLQCPDCNSGNENMCSSSQSVIGNGYGGFADRMIIDSRFCFPIPDAIETELAGPLLCAGITVFSGLKYAGMKTKQRIGVIGVGGLGHLAIQFAAKRGNDVTVFTTSPDKADFAVSLGASQAVITEKNSAPEALLPFDIIISTVPYDLDWNSYISLLNTDGTMTFVANPPSPLSIPVFLLLGKRRRIMSSPIGGRADMIGMLKIAADFGVKPVVETFPMERINDAIVKVRTNTIRYRAVVVNPE